MKNKRILKEKGITLIALVITIIVLLILAGVSIAMLTGENGILTQANNAKIEQSHGAVKEGIALAYNEYQIEINTASNMKVASTKTVQIQGKEAKTLASYSSFLDFLESKDYIKEETTDILNVEKLTGSKQALGNGTDTDVYKIEEENGKYIVNYYDGKGTPEEIWSIGNDDNVEISITKTNIPNDENVGVVLLTVDKVLQNGSEIQPMQVTEEEYKNMLLEEINQMLDEEREHLMVEIMNIILQPNYKFEDFEELLKLYEKQGIFDGIEGETLKDKFYNKIGGKEKFCQELIVGIYQNNYNLIGEYDKETGKLKNGCVITNPDGENSKTYVATKNGDYTFKVEINGKEYTKTINVDNIRINQENNNYNVENIDELNIGLKNLENDSYTTFSEAYIIYNNEAIDITEAITNENDISAILGGTIANIVDEKYQEFDYDLYKSIMIIKDGQVYYGKPGIEWVV